MQKNRFEVLRISPENTNSILVSDGDKCLVFDAWGLAADWEKVLNQRGLNLCAIYSTHGHPDHISAAPELSEKFNIPWYLNHQDIGYIMGGNSLLEYFGLPVIPENYKKPVDLCAGKLEILPNLFMNIIETPGHSAGGLMFYFSDEKLLIIGDTLFQESVGRYDLPGGNLRELLKSISKIYEMNLPDDTVVIHGHGHDTTIGWLKRNNNYFKKA